MTTPAAIGLVLDCQDPARLAKFWAAALDYVSVGTAGNYVALFPNDRPGPKLLLQQVPEPKTEAAGVAVAVDRGAAGRPVLIAPAPSLGER